MFRYLFAHETAFGLLTLAGVPNPNHYGLIFTYSFDPSFLRLYVASSFFQIHIPIVPKLSFHPDDHSRADQGVCHGDELALLYLPLTLTSSGDRQMSRTMVDWWSNFAKHG